MSRPKPKSSPGSESLLLCRRPPGRTDRSGAALVELPGRVEGARAEPLRHDAARLVRAVDERLELALARWIDEGLDRDVVRRLCRGEQLVQRALGLELRIVARGEHFLRFVLRRLDVRLVERVDLENRPGDRHCELPAEELAADRIRVGQMNLGALAIRAVEALAGRRDEPLALLARRLGDQLLGPEPEVPLGLLDAHLVATLPPALAELGAQLQPGVRIAAARLGHPLGVREQTLGFDAHQSSGNDPEG